MAPPKKNEMALAVHESSKHWAALAPKWAGDPEAYVRRVCTMAMDVWTDPGAKAITRCDKGSFLKAIRRCVSVGLEPNSPSGQAYLVPRGNQVCLEIHAKGWARMAMKQKVIERMDSYAVYEKDDLTWKLAPEGDTWNLDSYQGGDDPGELTHSMAVVTLPGGKQVVHVLRKHELSKMEKVSSGNSWKTGYEGMAAAKAGKFLFKRRLQGMDPLLQDAIEADDETEYLKDAEAVDVTGSLSEALSASDSPPEPEPTQTPPKKTSARKPAPKEPKPDTRVVDQEQKEPGEAEKKLLTQMRGAIWDYRRRGDMDVWGQIADKYGIDPALKGEEGLAFNTPEQIEGAHRDILALL